ncbi:hypothetical protein [Saccharothrix syringae]|uniref:DUF932 domain-containing protein n=1 Tax=Saccharothrix syringae TaxID=103733 RepID=A0A5Q0H493_SACSY|nr:hypothetical protein [Saccharothrix syringae]QFZ20552.1 hypothetical protein EKG83_26885 [Saccharothrix syringae]
MSLTTTVRNATFEHMLEMLRTQNAAKLDVVAPATTLRARDGAIELAGIEPVVDDHGVTVVDGLYVPTAAADTTIATKLDISVKYLRRLRVERPDLFDANVNGLLHGKSRRTAGGTTTVVYPADSRSFLLRLFRGQDGEPGVLRALLSDRFGMVDNLDLLTAVLDGIRQADVEVEIRSCDLTDSSMHCKVYSPAVARLAPTLLAGYRNPFANRELEAERQRITTDLDAGRRAAAAEGLGYEPGGEPVVFAGFRFSNSEIGSGSVMLKPELYVRICRNGLTLPALAYRRVHLGQKMEGGTVGWSQDTVKKQLDVIAAQARDHVREWLSPRFLARQVEQLEQQAGTPVTEPQSTVRVLGRELGFTEAEREGVLRHFIAGGQPTAAGIAHAITSYSQTVADPTRADALDDLALRAMTLVR